VDEAALLRRLADLVVGFGANLQRGQVVSVAADVGQEEAARAVAVAAYRRGARYVDVQYFDPYVKRARIEHSPDEFLDWVPPWLGFRLRALGDLRAARISLAGSTAPGLLADLDPARAGRDRLPWIDEILEVIDARTTNWTVAPFPTPAWAQVVHPELSAGEAYARLWEEVAYVCRLDEADPVAAWNARLDRMQESADHLNARAFDALHFEGPGTDLTIGLFRSSVFEVARDETIDGLRHVANVPSEEVYTTPDPSRAEGVVRSTKPLVLGDGSIVRGLRVRFESGRAVEIDADEGGHVLRGHVSSDEGGSRLGEVALVDGEGRIGRLGTVFYDTLLDENAASHIALGGGFDELVTDPAERERRNRSRIHIDFMIGGDDVDVTGITTAGERVPVLRGGAWQI
jgi:aminopeptidase